MSEGGISFNRTPGSGGGPDGPGGDKPEFELIRSAAPSGGDAPPIGLIAVVVVVALAGGAYFMFGSGGGGDSGGTTSKTGQPEVATATQKDVDVPPAILDLIDVKAEQDLEQGLAFAEEKLEEYPNEEIRERISRYRKELGLGLSADDLLKQVQELANQKQWADAIAKADQVLESEEDNKPAQNARAYYLRGACKGFSGERSAAVEDLKTAIELGFQPKSTAEKLVKKWSN